VLKKVNSVEVGMVSLVSWGAVYGLTRNLKLYVCKKCAIKIGKNAIVI